MGRQLVHDLPTRLFHWLFAGLFLVAFLIAKVIDDDSPTYSLHMLAGLTLAFVVSLRLISGFVGSRNARFTSFALKPSDLVNYLKGVLSGEWKVWVGHNPASSWAALLMMGLATGLAITGYLMTSGNGKETFEDVHELLANAFIVVVALHVGGIVLHTLRHKDMIGLAMITGTKASVPEDQAISSTRPGLAVLLAGLVAMFALHLYQNYDASSRRLTFFGASLQLGENEGNSDKIETPEGDEDGDDD